MKNAVILKADVEVLLRKYGTRAVLAELAGQLHELHLSMAPDHHDKWLVKHWSDKLETMAEEISKVKKS